MFPVRLLLGLQGGYEAVKVSIAAYAQSVHFVSTAVYLTWIYRLMGFGYLGENGDPVVTDSLLQGGIVCQAKPDSHTTDLTEIRRYPYTTLERSSDVLLEDGWVTRSEECVQSLLELRGRSLELRCSAQPRTTFG